MRARPLCPGCRGKSNTSVRSSDVSPFVDAPTPPADATRRRYPPPSPLAAVYRHSATAAVIRLRRAFNPTFFVRSCMKTFLDLFWREFLFSCTSVSNQVKDCIFFSQKNPNISVLRPTWLEPSLTSPDIHPIYHGFLQDLLEFESNLSIRRVDLTRFFLRYFSFLGWLL